MKFYLPASLAPSIIPDQVCNNEASCTCDTTWAGTDCSMPDPPKEPAPAEDEGPKGLFPSSFQNVPIASP